MIVKCFVWFRSDQINFLDAIFRLITLAIKLDLIIRIFVPFNSEITWAQSVGRVSIHKDWKIMGIGKIFLFRKKKKKILTSIIDPLSPRRGHHSL